MKSDLEMIAQLHEADEQAARRSDYRTLRSLMSDDAVILPPGGHLIRGREALDRSFARMAHSRRSADVIEYRFDWHEIEVCGTYAFEWGYIRGKERDEATGRVTAQVYHVIRILQKQSDGAWKVHRTIWNEPALDGREP